MPDQTFEILHLATPTDPDGAPSWQLEGMSRIAHRDAIDVLGYTDMASSARELHVAFADQVNSVKERFVAVDPALGERPEAVVGSLALGFPQKDNTHLAGTEILVDIEHRRCGIGTALWTTAQQRIAEHGRTTIIAESCDKEPDASAAHALSAPTGSGRVDARDPGVVFAQKLGFTLEQVERHSTQRLPIDAEVLSALSTGASEHAGPEFELVRWIDAVPEQWIGELGVLMAAMTTDIPKGDLDMQAAVFDAERIRHGEEQTRRLGYTTFVTAVHHIPSGELAGFTELAVDPDNDQIAWQEGTLVRKDYRGNRLGMLLKAANVAWLQQEAPQVQRVHTWNAEENGYMLAINLEIGYRPESAWASWQKRLG